MDATLSASLIGSPTAFSTAIKPPPGLCARSNASPDSSLSVHVPTGSGFPPLENPQLRLVFLLAPSTCESHIGASNPTCITVICRMCSLLGRPCMCTCTSVLPCSADVTGRLSLSSVPSCSPARAREAARDEGELGHTPAACTHAAARPVARCTSNTWSYYSIVYDVLTDILLCSSPS